MWFRHNPMLRKELPRDRERSSICKYKRLVIICKELNFIVFVWIKYTKPLGSLIHILYLHPLSKVKKNIHSNTSTPWFFTLHSKLICEARVRSPFTPSYTSYTIHFHCKWSKIMLCPSPFEIPPTLNYSLTTSVHLLCCIFSECCTIYLYQIWNL